MPVLRFSRDKRGYENTYLVQTTNRRGKPVKPRLLYWYRTPPGIRLGRSAFDEEVRRSLEIQNPGIAFDWPALINTPFPSQEPDLWRERRRAERAARQARREEEEGVEEIAPLAEDVEGDAATEQPPLEASATWEAVDVSAATPLEGPVATPTIVPAVTPITVPAAFPTDAQRARRRRRRGGRGRREGQSTGARAGSGSVDAAAQPPAASPDSSPKDPE